MKIFDGMTAIGVLSNISFVCKSAEWTYFL